MSTDPTPTTDVETLPRAEFAFPGPLRDQLVASILDGTKTSTTALLLGYEQDGEPLPAAGERSGLIDSHNAAVAVIEVTDVRVVPLGEVDAAHAADEGEGHTTVAEWRADHEKFWHSPELRQALGDPHFTVDDATSVVLERFQVVDRLDGAA